jgi:hypothetical protein
MKINLQKIKQDMMVLTVIVNHVEDINIIKKLHILIQKDIENVRFVEN